MSEEMGLSTVGVAEAALRVARRRGSEILESGDDPLLHARDFEQLWVRAGYPREIVSVGILHDDVYVAKSMNESEEQIRTWETARLMDLGR